MRIKLYSCFDIFFSIDPYEELIDGEMYVDVNMKQHEE